MENILKFPSPSENPSDDLAKALKDAAEILKNKNVLAFQVIILEELEEEEMPVKDSNQRVYQKWAYRDTHGILTLVGLQELANRFLMDKWISGN